MKKVIILFISVVLVQIPLTFLSVMFAAGCALADTPSSCGILGIFVFLVPVFLVAPPIVAFLYLFKNRENRKKSLIFLGYMLLSVVILLMFAGIMEWEHLVRAFFIFLGAIILYSIILIRSKKTRQRVNDLVFYFTLGIVALFFAWYFLTENFQLLVPIRQFLEKNIYNF